MNEKKEIVEKNLVTDNIGHGTAICSIICRKEMPLHVLVVKLFEDETVEEEKFLIALRYIKEHYKAKIIHFSIGIVCSEWKKELHNLCKELSENGSILVAAFSNDGALSYPAAFDEVIGVDVSFQCRKKDEMIFLENSPINIRTIGTTQRLPWKNNQYKFVMGASFAAPHVTYKILQYLDEGLKKNEIIEKLRHESKKVIKRNINGCSLPSKLFRIKKAVVVPFNKEIHALLRFSNQLTFEVEGIFDYSGLVRKNRQYFEHIKKENYQLLGWDEIKWETDFDTLIIGHMMQLNELLQHDYLKDFLEKCIKYRKNVVSFDPLHNYGKQVSHLKNNGQEVYFPAIENKFVDDNWLGKMPEISTPVVMIVGTGKKQGKFSLQLSLRYQLELQEYTVGQLSTEPSGELFGCDYVYPMGFNAQISTTGLDSIANIRFLMNQIAEKDYDIIITGTQSQTISQTLNNTAAIPFMNYEFILGADPEVFILVVDVYDELEYIQKTIHFCESICFGKVIAVCISPVLQNDYWTVLGSEVKNMDSYSIFLNKKAELESLEIPIFFMNEVKQISETIIEYLT